MKTAFKRLQRFPRLVLPSERLEKNVRTTSEDEGITTRGTGKLGEFPVTIETFCVCVKKEFKDDEEVGKYSSHKVFRSIRSSGSLGVGAVMEETIPCERPTIRWR